MWPPKKQLNGKLCLVESKSSNNSKRHRVVCAGEVAAVSIASSISIEFGNIIATVLRVLDTNVMIPSKMVF